MHDKKDGFSLVSLLIYLFLGSIMIIILIACALRTSLLLHNHAKKTHSVGDLTTAQHLITLGLRQAHSNVRTWYCIKPNHIIWHTNGSDHGLERKESRLFYSTGVYNAEKKQWTKREKSVLVDHVESCLFSCTVENEEVTQASYTITVNDSSLEKIVLHDSVYPRIGMTFS
jgi:hypothetical protein